MLHLGNTLKGNPEPAENTEVKKNWRIRVYPGAAWASYDNEAYDDNGEVTQLSKHDQFLEKQDGEWKIVYMSILRTTAFDNAAILLTSSQTRNENYGEDPIIVPNDPDRERFSAREYTNQVAETMCADC